jgi:xanthine dehydrogenase FAD-binding subunit
MVEAVSPKTLAEALGIRKESKVIPFAGGTDLMVRNRSWAGTVPSFKSPILMVGGIEELKEINITEEKLCIGAAASLSSIQVNKEVPEVLRKAIALMASPAIRNSGTLGGNICNASPAGDSLPPLYVFDATVVLQSVSGRREVPIKEFIKGPGKTGLMDDELLTCVNIPIESFDKMYYKKVGTRKADAISKLSFVGLAKIVEGSIADVRMAFGAVAATVVRSEEAERLLKGKKLKEIPELIPELKSIYFNYVKPIDDQRSNAAYREMAAYRIMEDFLLKL